MYLLIQVIFPANVLAQTAGTLITSGVTYNQDSSASITQAQNTSIRVPQNLINPTQGWIAGRIKMGFASTVNLSADPAIFDMSESDPRSLFVYYDQGSDTFHFERFAGSNGGHTAASGGQTFSAGTLKTIIVAWTATQLKVSIDGTPFVPVPPVANNTIPAQASFYIGTSPIQGAHRQPDSDYYWVAGGTGTLTDANAATIHAFGNTDKPRSAFPGSAAFIWWANNDQYNNDGSVGATNTPVLSNTSTPRPSITTSCPTGGVPGDANNDGRVDGVDFVAWLNHYNQAFSCPINGDFNKNGFVDGVDYSTWLFNYGHGLLTPTAILTSTPTHVTTPTSGGPTLPPPTPPSGTSGIWISANELAQLPISGPAWSHVKSVADGDLGSPDIANQDSLHDTNTLAIALVYARTGDLAYRTKAKNAIMSAIGTEAGARTLALGRNLAGYVIAADLINLRTFSPNDDATFRAWLPKVRNALISTHEDRPNNWGTHAGASREAADVYLGDKSDLARAAQVFKGWLGDRSSYAGFSYGALEWQCDASAPVGINRKGCLKIINGVNIDGALPEELRRGTTLQQNYIYGALSGALVQAVILSRAGYDTWNWSDQALGRAFKWLDNVAHYPASGNDTWEPHLINKIYGTSWPAPIPSSEGTTMGFTDWTHSR